MSKETYSGATHQLRNRDLGSSEEGATALEYGLIAAIIAIGLIVAVGGVADQVVSLFTTISGGITDAFN